MINWFPLILVNIESKEVHVSPPLNDLLDEIMVTVGGMLRG